MVNRAYPKRPSAPGAVKRKKPFDYEGREQTKLMNWIKGECKRGNLPEQVAQLIYAVPNGGSRHHLEAAKMKAQGVRAGVSDLVLPIARGGYFGLYLEFKATPPHDAAISESQKEWIQLVREQGYLSLVVKGIEDAKAVIEIYSSFSPTSTLDTVTQEDLMNKHKVLEKSAC